MAKIDAETVNRWRNMADDWMAANIQIPWRNVLDRVFTGRDAWTIAHRAGICREAYDMSRDIHDAHIQTALEKIFPNAVFRDKKRY